MLIVTQLSVRYESSSELHYELMDIIFYIFTTQNQPQLKSVPSSTNKLVQMQLTPNLTLSKPPVTEVSNKNAGDQCRYGKAII